MKVLDKAAPEVDLLRKLDAELPGRRGFRCELHATTAISSCSASTSDRNPGDFYLFDRAAKKATFLLAGATGSTREDGVDAARRVRARDGTKIHGYLTLPPGSDGKNLPLIVNPHGGPFGPFDDWGYNREVAAASRTAATPCCR